MTILRHSKPRTRSILCRILPAFILTAASGCIGLSKDHAPRRYYVLRASDNIPGVVSELSAAKPCLMLRTLTISPLFSRKEFTYRLTENEYQTDYYNQFFTSPASILREQVARELSNADEYNFVFSNTSQLTPEYSLEVYITALYGDLRDREAPKAVASMVVYLVKAHENQTSLIFTHSYKQDIALPARTPESIVNGWNQGLGTMLAKLHNDIATSINADQDVPGTPE
jgi:cholesterol transport system auxiliary component